VPGLAACALFPGGLEWCRLSVAAAAVLGHMFTVFAGFRGGKGVATSVGVLLALSPPAFAAFLASFVATVALTRYISLGSMLGSAAFAITLGLTHSGGFRSPTFGFGVLLAVGVVLRHRENIARLARGEERRFSFKRSAA
jgi:glycerol-3-phosphate acyltransferase PlsY